MFPRLQKSLDRGIPSLSGNALAMLLHVGAGERKDSAAGFMPPCFKVHFRPLYEHPQWLLFLSILSKVVH